MYAFSADSSILQVHKNLKSWGEKHQISATNFEKLVCLQHC